MNQRKNLHRLGMVLLVLMLITKSQAEVVTVELDRQIDDKQIVISALVRSPSSPNGKAIFLFPGWPGIPRIETKNEADSYFHLQEHFEEITAELNAAGITAVTVDCPTDQWGWRGYTPTACNDDYRSSEQHALDVTKLINKIKTTKSLNDITLMGHSYGAISSHWLSTQLDQRLITRVIHSASQTVAGGGQFANYGSSMKRFDHQQSKVPYFYLHHRDDLCSVTPYAYAASHAKDGALMTVLGGKKWASPCGGSGYHSYGGRRKQLAEALIILINKSEVTETITALDD